ncbi:MAG TPA: YHYH domain-containing protein [Anaerolineales bacterium]|nr:YHYH domain-containing protein [Anaerolineales bacterium]
MKAQIWIFILMMLLAGPVFAHGGGLDKCGGHNDRKRGGYHVHNHAKYCSCYPQSENCVAKDGRESKPEQKDKSAPPPSKQ